MYRPYICPLCKSNLEYLNLYYFCHSCRSKFIIENGIPDFLTHIPIERENLILQSVTVIDKLAKIYETNLWYPIVYHVFGGIRIPSVKDTIKKLIDMIEITKGIGIDIACGTGLYMRPLAEKIDQVYGIDISKGMLNKAKKNAHEQNIKNIELARAKVEKLPFPNEYFDAACCSGALHLFPDTLSALKEISRVLKAGGPFAVMTFIRRRFFKNKFVYKHLKEKHGAIIFEITELKNWLEISGFEDFKPNIYGSMILFSVRKK